MDSKLQTPRWTNAHFGCMLEGSVRQRLRMRKITRLNVQWNKVHFSFTEYRYTSTAMAAVIASVSQNAFQTPAGPHM